MDNLYTWDNSGHKEWIYFKKEYIFVLGYDDDDNIVFNAYKNDGHLTPDSWILGPSMPLKPVKHFGKRRNKTFIREIFENDVRTIIRNAL